MQATVTDARGNTVAGQMVSFSASNGAIITTVIETTGADGIATATLTSSTAGISSVTATVNGKSQTVDVNFKADESTAEITAANLTVTTDNAVADGTATNAVQATVTDARGNTVAGQMVSFSASNGALITTVIETTGADGIATATLTSSTAGISSVTATVNGKSQTVDVNFAKESSFTNITANNHNFAMDASFPNAAFKNAMFKINATESADSYIWSSDSLDSVSVNANGEVTFNSQPMGTITITATPIDGGPELTYSFRLSNWYVGNGYNTMTQSEAETWCTQKGMSQPSSDMLSSGTNRRSTSSLWGQWGNIVNSYPNSEFVGFAYWSNSKIIIGSSVGYYMYTDDGRLGYNNTGAVVSNVYVICNAKI